MLVLIDTPPRFARCWQAIKNEKRKGLQGVLQGVLQPLFLFLAKKMWANKNNERKKLYLCGSIGSELTTFWGFR